MISLDAARERMLLSARETRVESVPLAEAAGRVPAEWTQVAAGDVPPFANSAMDGVAIRAADAPGELRLVGEVIAGARDLPQVGTGEAVRIMTGAPIPPGADAVVPVEEVDETRVGVVTVPAVRPGQHIRPRGHDTRVGDRVDLPRAPLGPASVALLASLGLGSLSVRRRPRVAILTTGTELVDPGARLLPGQVHDANSVALAAAVLGAGGEPLLLARAPDDPVAIEALMSAGLAAADLLVASGGVSMGRTDHVRSAIERLGTLDFWKVSVQPGKPLAFGLIDGLPVVGLPGNPVSALVTFELFARPMIRRMLGLGGDGRVHLPARLEEPISKDPERRAFIRVVLSWAAGGLVAHSAGGQGSAQLRAAAVANGLLVIPEGVPAGLVGATYDATVIGDLA